MAYLYENKTINGAVRSITLSLLIKESSDDHLMTLTVNCFFVSGVEGGHNIQSDAEIELHLFLKLTYDKAIWKLTYDKAILKLTLQLLMVSIAFSIVSMSC